MRGAITLWEPSPAEALDTPEVLRRGRCRCAVPLTVTYDLRADYLTLVHGEVPLVCVTSWNAWELRGREWEFILAVLTGWCATPAPTASETDASAHARADA